MEALAISDEKQDGFLVVRLQGMVNAPQAPELEQRLLGRIDGGARRLIIDCAQLSFISSAGLRVLLAAARKLKRANGKLGLAALPELVLDVFVMAGFAEIFEFFPGVPEAVQALR